MERSLLAETLALLCQPNQPHYRAAPHSKSRSRHRVTHWKSNGAECLPCATNQRALGKNRTPISMHVKRMLQFFFLKSEHRRHSTNHSQSANSPAVENTKDNIPFSSLDPYYIAPWYPTDVLSHGLSDPVQSPDSLAQLAPCTSFFPGRTNLQPL